MSVANKCDVCGKLYEAMHGTAVLGEVSITNKDGKTMSSWSDVDLCVKCTAELIEVIAPALNDIELRDV